MVNVFQILNKIFGVYAIFLTISGTIANLLSCIVCFRMRKNTTFIFLTFMTISDMVSLYWWNINNFLKEFASIDLLTINMYVCKVGNYLQFTSLQISAWILVIFSYYEEIKFFDFLNKVLISFDRYMSIQIKHWKKIYFSFNRAFLAVFSIIIFLLLANINILFTFGYDTVIGNSSVSLCFEVDGFSSTHWMTVWGKIHLMTYSVVPFLVLLVANFLLIRKIKSRKLIHLSFSSSTNVKKSKKNDRINRTVLLLTFLFIIMTLPLACASFFFTQLIISDFGLFAIVFFNCISFSYHGFNFIFMAFSNKIFREEYKKLFKCNF